MRRAAGTGAALVLPALVRRASAHSELLGSSVSLDAAILRANVEAHVVLRFSGSIQPRESRAEIVPELPEHGDARRLPLVFGPEPGEVVATCPALIPGRYQLRYHVVAADGHVTDGAVPVRVAAPE